MKSGSYQLSSAKGQSNLGFVPDNPKDVLPIQTQDGSQGYGTDEGKDGADPRIPDTLLGTKKDPYQKWRLTLTAILIMVWLCLGFYQTLVGPTLPDLKDRLGVNYEEISFALTGRDIGVLVGSLVGGYMNERLYHHSLLMIGICTLIPAGITAAVPHLPNLGLMFAFLLLNGIMEGITNAGGNTMILHMWGEQSASPMSAMHGGFGLAATIAPIFASPFLGPEEEETDDDFTTTLTPFHLTTMENSTAAPQEVSRIEVPYGIVGIICLVGSIIVFASYFKGPPKQMFRHTPSASFKEMARPSVCGHGYTFFAIELLIMLFFYFFQTVGISRTYGNYIFSFAYETKHLGFSKSSASLLTTCYWIGFTFGRFGGAIMGRFVKTQYMIAGYQIGAAIAVTIIAIFGYDHAVALWICTVIMGMFAGVMYPLGMAWANIYLHMNSLSVMIPLIGASVGGTCYAYLVGNLFEKDTRNWTYVLVGWSAIFIVVFIIMQSLAYFHGSAIFREMELDKVEVEDEKTFDVDAVLESDKKETSLGSEKY